MLVIIVPIIFLGCHTSNNKFYITSKATENLNDELSPIAEVQQMFCKGLDSIYITDNLSNISLFVANKFNKTVGIKGKGPGEYYRVTSFYVNSDTLFILDRSLSKIIWYNIKTNKFIGEIVNNKLIEFRSFVCINGIFYLFYTEYSMLTNLVKPIIYTLAPKGKLDPLQLHFKDLDIVASIAPLSIASPIETKKIIIYFVLPLCDRVWMYNIKTKEITSFKIKLDVPKGNELRSISNANELFSLVKNKIEFVFGLYTLDKYIAIVSKQGADNFIKYYSYSGNYIGKLVSNLPIFNVTAKNFSVLGLNSTKESHYPYFIKKESYSLRK